MASTSTASNDSSNGTSNGTRHGRPGTIAIDFRLYLAIIITSMMVFFGIGIASTASITDMTTLFADTVTLPSGGAASSTDSSTASGTTTTKDDRGLNERHVNFEQPSYEDLGTGDGAIQYSAKMPTSDTPNTANASTSEHLPAGQHLLVDIKNLEAAFLNSEERLAKAMVDTVSAAGLTMLSYHCHSLIPAGVSCVGVLLESHISFHTWPDEGVITLDLFTCGDKPLLPVVPVLEKLFGIPRSKSKSNSIDGDSDSSESENDDEEDEKEEIFTLWSHELRGFRDTNDSDGDYVGNKYNYLDSKSDLASWIISPLEFVVKKQVVSAVSEFHRIDIWDFLGTDDTPSYEDALKHNLTKGDPRWLTSEVASPDRILFVNGILQSEKEFERQFHETLVHPTMFAHPKPVHVAVIGGGEGATIREILKHETVESVTMIEIDQKIVEIAREHLPYMNDCSDIVGVAENCFDDERTTVIYEDGKKWFVDRFGANPTKESPVEKFDVIILDALEPKNNKDMHNDPDFMNSIMNALSEDGTMSIYIGEPHTIHDARADLGSTASRERFFKDLEANPATGAMFVYEESHCGLDEPCAFLAVCKNSQCRDNWFAESMVIDYEMNVRIKETKSSKPNLLLFDGATQHSYQITPRAWEDVYCRREPTPFECAYRGLDLTKDLYEMDLENESESSFRYEVETVDGKEKTSIYATTDIPKGSYIMPSDVAASFTIGERSLKNLQSNVEIDDTGDVSVIKNFLQYVEDFGHDTFSEGRSLRYVEVGGSFMMRKSPNNDEVNVARWVPVHPSGKQPVYSPVYDRRMNSFDVFLVASKDIKEGDEIVKPMDLWSS